jgi:hypothetical protein
VLGCRVPSLVLHLERSDTRQLGSLLFDGVLPVHTTVELAGIVHGRGVIAFASARAPIQFSDEFSTSATL